MSGNANAAARVMAAADNEKIELRRVECHLSESLLKRILRRIFPDERKQQRLPAPPLVAYLGTASASRPFELGDISLTGFCLLTGERWMPGTEMPITLQSKNLPAENERESFTVQATVVRCGNGGVGFSIVLSEEDSQSAYGNPLHVQWVTRAEMEKYLKRLTEQPGSQTTQIEKPVLTESAAGSRSNGGLKAAFEGGR
ncbi:PilZ domain-containing protein [Telmatobacter sp. DSM 110680]|uniref:PilZ domain-containing protein n=1 Tax=Telmatobacter sp. DSM 110680 TaxID=3036704 RepID=A0AAU7DHE1_9BACT